MAAKKIIKSYVLTQDFKAPYVQSTGIPHRPTQIKVKHFKKGDQVKGELIHDNGKPAVVMVRGVLPVPVSVIKEVVTKDIVYNSAEGSGNLTPKKLIDFKKPADTKMKYLDAILIGAVSGFVLSYYAEKKGWITPVEGSAYQNKLIGLGIGALLGAYVVYRFKQPSNVGTATTVKEETI